MKHTTAFLKALADENRIKMLDLLSTGPMCVNEICRHFEMRQPSVSHHLNILKQAGIVMTEKCGKEKRYYLNHDVVNNRFDGLCDRYASRTDTDNHYSAMLEQLRVMPDIFSEGAFGLEKENLRINDKGCLDQTDHPVTKDDPYYKYLIKDFAECQVEFVTEPKENPASALEELTKLQDHFIDKYDVRLWSFSMPSCINKCSDIRIAEYDDTEEGRAARRYREMLAERHGRKMQLISGIHYNFSFGERMVEVYRQAHPGIEGETFQQIKNRLYFHVARNLLRYKWLLIYLTGASPFVDATYKEEVTKQLKSIEHNCTCCEKAHTYYEDYATSLRMSRYGYHNKLQEEMSVSYNRLEEYISQMRSGIHKGILQKESEYYAPLRFKNSHGIKGSMLDALEAEGVEYLELRMFDLNPYETYGIDENLMYLTHLFLIYSFMKPSPCISLEEMNRIYSNGQRISLFGRKNDVEVFYRGSDRDVCELGCSILTDLEKIAGILDEENESGSYMAAVSKAKSLLNDDEKLPSAKLTKELLDGNMTYVELGLKHSITGMERKEMTVK